MPSKSELRKQFCGVTRSNANIATEFLERHDWDVNRATFAYFDDSQSTSKKSSPAPPKALSDLFMKYRDPENESIISIEGTISYLQDLQIEPEDPRSLTLAYLLQSPQTGEFHKEIFLNFWSQNRISSLSGMRKLIDKSHLEIMASSQKYEDFYQYCFDFIRGSDSRIKSINAEDAVLHWDLLFDDCHHFKPCSERLKQWYDFVKISEKPISKDTWIMFYKFIIEVMLADPAQLSGYDEMSSWPSLVDEYIEWLQEVGHLEASHCDQP